MRHAPRPTRAAAERFRFAGAGKPAALPPGAMLQPVLHDPIAAWALLDDDDGTLPYLTGLAHRDRVSGTYPLTRTPGTVQATADLIKGFRCAHGGSSARPLGRDDRNGGGVEPIFKWTGEFTVSLRVWWSGSTAIGYPAVFDVSEGWSVRNGANGMVQTFARLYMVSADGSLGGFHQRALGGYSYSDRGWTSPLKLTPGAWTYVALRRTAAGAYTVTRNADHATGPALGDMPLPQYGQAAALNLGQWGSVQLSSTSIPYAGGDAWQGGFADVMVWDKRLTDAQIDNQRAVMFALEAA